MNCTECRDQLVASIEGLLQQAENDALESHLRQCDACNRIADEYADLHVRLMNDGQTDASVWLTNNVMDQISREQNNQSRDTNMFKRYARITIGLLSAAAAIAIIFGTSVAMLGTGAVEAYAIEQTIEANHNVRFFHIKCDPPGDGISEGWAQLDEQGKPLLLRIHFEVTDDGPKQIVWQQDKAEVYMSRKNSVLVVYDKKIRDYFVKMMTMFDPLAAMEELYAAEAKGEVTIETQMPTKVDEPIKLIATPVDNAKEQKIYRIAPDTKLIQAIEVYCRVNDAYELVYVHEYLEYRDSDEQADETVFTLNPPEDVLRIDQTTQVIGLAQGDLTDEEIAVKTVRAFFEAWIAEDFAEVGRIFSGIPESRAKEMLGKIRIVRIVSIGEPTPHSMPGVGGFQVPCEVEIERDSQTSIWKLPRIAVRRLKSQPDRWNIHGGI